MFRIHDTSDVKMVMVAGVYKITNINNGRMYVGSTSSFRRRWNEHKSLLNRGIHKSPILQNSWNKHGQDSFVFEIISTHPPIKEVLLQAEQSHLDSGLYSYNISPTASSQLGIKRIEEQKRAMSEQRKGRRPSPEATLKNSLANRGTNNHFYGKTHSLETKEKMSLAKIGKPHTNRKPVYKVDMLTKVEVYYPLIAATRNDGFSPAKVGAVCRGKRKSHGGYFWKYANPTHP